MKLHDVDARLRRRCGRHVTSRSRRVRGRSSRSTARPNPRAPAPGGAARSRSSATCVGVTTLAPAAVDRAVAGDHPRLQSAAPGDAMCGDEPSSSRHQHGHRCRRRARRRAASAPAVSRRLRRRRRAASGDLGDHAGRRARWARRRAAPARGGGHPWARSTSSSSVVIVAERDRERLPGAEQHRLDRALGDAEVLGDLADVEAEVVAEHGDLALATGERAERLAHRVRLAARRGCVAQVVAQGSEAVARPPLRTPPAHLAAGEVERDGRDPRREPVDPVAPIEALPRARQRFLHRVLGGGDAAAHERDGGHDLGVLAVDEVSDPVVVHLSTEGLGALAGRSTVPRWGSPRWCTTPPR